MAVVDEPLLGHLGFGAPFAPFFIAFVFAEVGVCPLVPFGVGQGFVPDGLGFRTGGDITSETFQFLKVTAVYQFVVAPFLGRQKFYVHVVLVIHFQQLFEVCAVVP